MRILLAKLRPYQVVLVLGTAYMAAILLNNGWDPSAFVRIGSRFDPGLPHGSMGYDGQFSYQIAVDPINAPSKLDVPAYRLQRILYPILARLAALGRPQLIPWTLVIINLVALACGVAATEAMLVHYGNSRWWALAYGLNVGMLMSVRLDLTEPTAYLFVQLGALAWAKDRHRESALAFLMASLAKEVTLIIALGYGLGQLRKAGLKSALKWALLVLAPFVVWQGVLSIWIGRVGIGSGGALSTPFEILPFRGWWGIATYYDMAAFITASILVVPLILIPAMAGIFTSFRALTEGFIQATALSLAAQSISFLFLPTSNLLDPLGASRYSIGLIACFLAFGASRKNRSVLAYSQLWIITLVFLVGDNFLPSG